MLNVHGPNVKDYLFKKTTFKNDSILGSFSLSFSVPGPECKHPHSPKLRDFTHLNQHDLVL